MANILDIYAGTGSATRAFVEAGHRVILLEQDPSVIDYDLGKLPANVGVLLMDAREFAKSPQRYLDRVAVSRGWIRRGQHWVPDFIWLSPPCQAFSMAGSGSGKRRWKLAPYGGDPLYGPRVPANSIAQLACDLVLAGLQIVAAFPGSYWLMENPRAGLRTMGFMARLNRWTITHCQYGDTRMKPTDLWGEMPAKWNPKPYCSNGDSCHVSAPRGSQTPGSTQGIEGAKDRGRLPIKFSKALVRALK